VDVHETMLALTLHVRPIFKIYNSTVLCIAEFTSHLLSDRYTIILVVREWELEGMEITNYRNRTAIKLGYTWDREWE